MRPGGLAVARARARSDLLLALCGIVAAATFALIGLDALHGQAARDATRDALTAGSATAAALNIQVDTGQDDVRKRLPGLPVTVVRAIRTTAFPARHDGRTVTLTARADAGLANRSRIVEGRWPRAGAAGLHATLQADTAKRLDISIGDTLRIGKLDVVIDGTWRPIDPTAAAWFGDPAIASGLGPEGSGPLVLSESDLARLPAERTTSYVLTPRSSDDLPGLQHDLRKLTTALESTQVSETVTGGLPQRLANLQTTRAAGNGLLAVAYVLLALASLVACRQVTVLLTEARHTETGLMRSRGATITALTRAATIETAVIAAASSAVGLGAAVAVFGAVDNAPDPGLAILVAALCALVAATLAGVTTWSSARRAGLRRDEPRDRRGARTTILIVVLAAAALSVGQFIAYDGPLSGSSTSARVDPITSLAPAVALAALALLGSVVAAPLLRLGERSAVRRTGLSPSFPARQLARRLRTFGVAIVLVSLAVGFAILTAAVDGTQTSLDDAAARVRNGADVRLDLAVEPSADVGVESSTAPLLGLGERSAAVVLAPGRIDQDKVSFLAAPAGLPEVAAASQHDADTAQIRAGLAAKPVGVPIQPGSADVRIKMTGARPTGDLQPAVWLVDDRGQVAVRPLASVSPHDISNGPVTRTVAIPRDRHGWRLLAVGAKVIGPTGDATIEFSGLPGADRYDATLANGRDEARAMAGAVPTRLPVVITPAVAALVDVRRGDTFDLLLPDSGFNQKVTVAGISSTIPGIVTARGIAADLPTLTSYALAKGTDVPAPNSVWIATEHPRDIVREAASHGVVPMTSTTAAPDPGSRVVASAVHVWWWAAGAVIIFAALATAAMSASLGRARRGELQVLRALGLTGRRQSKLRSAELWGAIGVGAVIGLLAGFVTVLLTARILARSATPERPAAVEPHLSLVTSGLFGLAVLLALSLALVSIAYARRIRHEAGRPDSRGDAT
jgi:hypothetical protein